MTGVPSTPFGGSEPSPSTAVDLPNDRAATLYPDDLPSAADASNEALAEASADTTIGKPGAPRTYDLKPPEGFEISADIAREATSVFQELGLSNDAANKLLPLAGKVIERHIDSVEDEFTALKKSWAHRTLSDPKIGGPRWGETQRLIDRALNAAGAGEGSEFRQFLDDTGLGNHPEMIRIFRYFGGLVREDTGPKPRESILYPSD